MVLGSRKTACTRLTEGALTEPSLNEIAKSLNMSYSLFRQRFLRLTGKSPGKFRKGEIIKKACLRITGTNDSLTQIADQLGFHDQFHFSRSFKRETGMSPSAFRSQVSK